MDKRIAGKWYKEELGETINIFDESPLRMKMSFSSSGYYNCEPNYVYEKDRYLCFEINDEMYRMVYHICYEEGLLKGYYTQHGKETYIQYEKVSDIADDDQFEYKPTEIIVPGTDETRINILKKYSAYSDKKRMNAFSYTYKLFEQPPHILQKYHYNQYISKASKANDSIAFILLDFVCDHFKHDGSIGTGQGRKVEDIIETCEKHGGKVNCRGLAILLASLLRMNGIKASHVTCMPYEDPFEDCHVVVDCLLPSGKRIMFDPTYRLYLKAKDDTYVSLPNLRKMLINDEEYKANEQASYNGIGFNLDEQRQYMIKNTFRFSRGIISQDGYDDRSSQRVELIPSGYPIDNFKGQNKREFVYSEDEFWNCF